MKSTANSWRLVLDDDVYYIVCPHEGLLRGDIIQWQGSNFHRNVEKLKFFTTLFLNGERAGLICCNQCVEHENQLLDT